MRSPRDPVPPRHDPAPVVAASRPLRWSFAAMLLIAALIHLVPLVGVLGADALERLYGLRFEDPDRLLLMRHRAVLFGLLGLGLLVAIRIASWRTPMLIAGITSTAAFLLLAALGGDLGPAVQGIVRADVIALGALLIAAALAPRLASGTHGRAPNGCDRAPDRRRATRLGD